MPVDADANERLKELIASTACLRRGRRCKCGPLPDRESLNDVSAAPWSMPNYLPSNWPRCRASSQASIGSRPVISLYQAGWNVQAHASLTAPRIIA
jgi:hypothetical protein